MEPMSRRVARGQQLPPHEVELLNRLNLDHLIIRVADLYGVGWSLQSIGDSLVPRRQRSTVRSWVLRASEKKNVGHTVSVELPMPANEVELPEIPLPVIKLTPTSGKNKLEVSEDVKAQIHQLAPLARTYRSRMSSTSAAATANSRLTSICKQLYDQGVSVKELAALAGVTYRAMYKRLFL